MVVAEAETVEVDSFEKLEEAIDNDKINEINIQTGHNFHRFNIY
jgi:hypothetical protein